MSTKALTQSIPFIEARNTGRKQRPKTIMLRLSETTSESGAAMGIATYWNSSASPMESCHYVVDEEYAFQCVSHDLTAYSSQRNEKGIISINVCAQPTFNVEDWKTLDRILVLNNAAKLTAKLCEELNIPVRYVDLLDHRRIFSRGGIMVSVRGSWPTHAFLQKVEDQLSHY